MVTILKFDGPLPPTKKKKRKRKTTTFFSRKLSKEHKKTHFPTKQGEARPRYGPNWVPLINKGRFHKAKQKILCPLVLIFVFDD